MHVLVLLALISTGIGASLVGQPAPSKTVRIDGAEHPELIPDHWVWRANFLRLSAVKQQGGEAALAHDLPLGQADADALYKEAALQPQRDAACLERITARQRELRAQAAGPDSSRRALDEITIDCRTRDLDAADRVMDALTDEGRAAVTAWLERRRKTMVAFVPAEDMETFRLPR